MVPPLGKPPRAIRATKGEKNTLRSVDSSRRQLLVLSDISSRIFRIFGPVGQPGCGGGLFSLRDAIRSVGGANMGFYSSRATRRDDGPRGGHRGKGPSDVARETRGDQGDMFCVLRRSDRRRGHRSSLRRRSVQPLNPGIMRQLHPAGWMMAVAREKGRGREIY